MFMFLRIFKRDMRSSVNEFLFLSLQELGRDCYTPQGRELSMNSPQKLG
jgi:hypothetical protein